MRILIIILSLSLLISCGQKGKTKDGNSATAELQNIEIIENTDNIDERYLIIIPDDMEVNDEQFDYVEFLDDHADDTIAVGMLGMNNQEVGLLRQLKLGEKWLCIMFPNKAYRRTHVEVDTLTTTEYMMNDFPQDYYITLLSVKDPERNWRYFNSDNGSLLDYNIAFRGDYDISDFHYYDRKELSSQDSVHITNTIRNAMQKGAVKRPYYLPTDSLHLVEMYNLKDGLYGAKYKPEYKDDLQGGYTKYYSVFLIKNDKVLLWDSGDYSIALEVFSLKGQDYVWVEEFAYATSFTDLYMLDDKLTGIYHSTFTGD